MQPLVLLAIALLLIFANPLQPRQGHPGDSLLRTVHQFPNETWVENLAVRANGKILVTFVSAPEVWQVDPSVSPATGELIYSFPNATAALGIAEYAPDVFAINVGNKSSTTGAFGPGSWSVWSLNMQSEWNEQHRGTPNHSAQAHKIADITSAAFLNGMTALPANPTTVLLADSADSLIYSLDTTTGAYGIAVEGPALKPNASAPIVLGVNGVHFRPGETGYVYFTNTFHTPKFSRIPVDPMTGKRASTDEAVVDLLVAPDDFTINSEGTAAYLADGALNGLVKVDLSSGKVKVLTGGTEHSKTIGQTSCQFGRSEVGIEKGTLYITTDGGLASPPPQGIVGGGVYALDTAGL